MAIYRVNNKKSRQDQISDLNEMVLENEGNIEEAQFNKYELDDLYSQITVDRKFLRNQTLGGTTSNYTNWSHLRAENGYSIWKLTPTTYTYNANNNLYFDDKVLENRGEASSESSLTFDSVFFQDNDSGGSFTNNTTEAGTEGGTSFLLMNSTTDYLYIGDDNTFSGMSFEWETRGSGLALKVEYYNGAWVQLTVNTNNLDDDTSNFESNGKINWTIPDDWLLSSINTASRYWIRISSTSTPVTVAKPYSIIPYNSVPALLALSSTQIQEEDWAWCTFGSTIYVTIRNEGNSSYEGNYFIKSSSNATNLQNFFVHNHTYTADYEDSSYDPVITVDNTYTVTGNEGIILVNEPVAITITLPTAVGNEGKRITVKRVGSNGNVTLDPESGVNIDGSGTYILSAQWKYVTVISDGHNWLIIANN